MTIYTGEPNGKRNFKEWNEFLTESSISRTYEHMLNHDTAFITAFRDNAKDTTKVYARS